MQWGWCRGGGAGWWCRGDNAGGRGGAVGLPLGASSNLAVSNVGELGAAHKRWEVLGREVVDANLKPRVLKLCVVEGGRVLDGCCNVL